MPKYVLINRRAGLFTEEAKMASRSHVASVVRSIGDRSVLSDHAPSDPLARRVVIFEAGEDEVANLRRGLSKSVIVEPLVRRQLHTRHPGIMRGALPLARTIKAGKAAYTVKITGGGNPLPGIQVMLYLSDVGGQQHVVTESTDGKGVVSYTPPRGFTVSMVEPLPWDSYWIMLAQAPASGSTIDCLPIAEAPTAGNGWWHDVMNVDTTVASRGAGIKVGVIDTGCGPHPNLAHVNLVGAYVDGTILPGPQATDVAQHGTHTSGIIGARPTQKGDYAGMAPGCGLYHARVFKSEEEGPSQADLINAIDALSRDNGCDLINMSLGGGDPTQAEEDAIRDALERGTLCICSAGNDGVGQPIDYPGAYPECAAVSAIGLLGWAPSGTFSKSNTPQDPSMIGASNLFLAIFSCVAVNGQQLACAGPGVGIVSTVPDRSGSTGRYMEMDGTSMASPAACGALAVILSKNADYKALPRDASRSSAALTLLNQHSKSIGLATNFEGRGLPQV